MKTSNASQKLLKFDEMLDYDGHIMRISKIKDKDELSHQQNVKKLRKKQTNKTVFLFSLLFSSTFDN